MGLGPRPLARTVDVTVASVARMYDYLLRGKDSYPADRAACQALVEVMPNAVALVEAQKVFSLGAVDRLSSHHAVRQFLDFGCGLPAWVNTHQVARSSRVVYIDKDPMVVAHGRALLDEGGRTEVVQGDLLEGEDLLGRPQVAELIDLEQPVAVLMTSLLHCIGDDEQPAAALRSLLGRLANGSFLVLSQWVSEDPGLRDRVGRVMRRSTAGAWGQVRRRAEVDAFFGGLALEEPGLGDVSAWARAERGTAPAGGVVEYGGVGRIQR
ncbi:S-adenosyl methyltransferase [Streptomyces sp. PanSC19]|uniref:SAM-dependent methyltransferase n=1 Tax=Streptomyces sp. PanSC19 TaxID=1520455 RepID=UPI000F91EC77|nr:SAM-dependent methyltransferase [Streptomyces sp. PanSC19]ROQ23603.1 S-adenosyl methyltransferase [Streptomyces sp. PanSC19]